MRDRKVLCRFCENLRYTQTHTLVHTHRVIKQKPTESIYREWAWVNYEAHLFKDWLPGDIFTPSSSDSHAPEMKMYLGTHTCVCLAVCVSCRYAMNVCCDLTSFLWRKASTVCRLSLFCSSSPAHSTSRSFSITLYLSLSFYYSLSLSFSLSVYVNYILYIHRNEHTQCANKKRRAAQNVFYTD